MSTSADYLEWIYPRPSRVLISCAPPSGTTYPPTAREHLKGRLYNYHGQTWDTLPDAVDAVGKYVTGQARAIWSSVHRGGGMARGNKWDINQTVAYQFLALDFDNVTPAELGRIAATDAEVERIGEHVSAVKADLIERGLPEPLHVATGNGHLLMVPVELWTVDDPFDPQARRGDDNIAMMKRLADCLAVAYSRPFTNLDTGVIADPSRILGVPGTINKNKPERPAEGRIARRREIVGNFPDREPMTEPEFVAWAESYIAECERLNGDKLAERRRRQPDPSAPATGPVIPPDAHGIARYIAAVPPAVEGCGGDAQTFRLCGNLLAFGLSEPQVFECLHEWNSRCSPPWSDDELKTKIHSAAHNGTARPKKTLNAVGDCGWNSSAAEEIDGPTVPMPAKPAREPAAPIDLHQFPKEIRDLTNALSTVNRIMPPVLHLGAAYSVIGALIGKRVSCENHGNKLYPNLSVVCLMSSSGNKTGTFTPLRNAYIDHAIEQMVPTSTFAALYDVMGVSIDKKKFAAMPDLDRKEIKQNHIREARKRKDGFIIMADECTDDLNNLLGSWDSKNANRDIEKVLQLFDGGSVMQKQLAGEGYKLIADTCVSLCGFSQNQTWEKAFGDSDKLARGLFGRFVPWTDRYLKLDGHGPTTATVQSVFATVKNRTAVQPDDITCTFGPPCDGPKDSIGQIMDEVAETPNGKSFARIYPNEWAVLRNKIINHAIKAAMIDGFLENVREVDPFNVQEATTIDCLHHFRRHAELFVSCYLSYYQQVQPTSAYGELEQRVLRIARRDGFVTKRDTQRQLHVTARDLAELLANLVQAGELIVSSSQPARGPKMPIWKIPEPE
jgi:hypothetical protein